MRGQRFLYATLEPDHLGFWSDVNSNELSAVRILSFFFEQGILTGSGRHTGDHLRSG